MSWSFALADAPFNEMLLIWVKTQSREFPAVAIKVDSKWPEGYGRSGPEWYAYETYSFTDDDPIPDEMIMAWAPAPKGPDEALRQIWLSQQAS